MLEIYKQKVASLINTLPYLAAEPDLALHGGTAINLFERDMPRLSVDLDFTFIPLKDREASLAHIDQILGQLKSKIESGVNGAKVDHDRDRCKLIILQGQIDIKLEVNAVMRGALSNPRKMALCLKAQEEFEAFVEMPVIPFGQLYGGKICAALDRQHPRDLFDIKHLMAREGFSDDVRAGFIYSLISSGRPMHELLDPHLLDQRKALENQFYGMASEGFSYDEFEKTRELLIRVIRSSLSSEDRAFLLSISRLEPDWSLYDFRRFPAVQWKISNLSKLKSKNIKKYQDHCRQLEQALNLS